MPEVFMILKLGYYIYFRKRGIIVLNPTKNLSSILLSSNTFPLEMKLQYSPSQRYRRKLSEAIKTAFKNEFIVDVETKNSITRVSLKEKESLINICLKSPQDHFENH